MLGGFLHVSKNYKESLSLPQTDFPMKADLAKKDPAILEFWEKERVFHRLVEKNRGGPPFVLHDGPPYANGHIHLGHVLNKVLKDVIVKFKNLKGFEADYIPGWDCHGLPIELQVVKDLGSK